jgi:voltage-gated potassium channel Kch
MGLLGYTKRTSFFMGLLVSQISEFSLIFIALGISVGHINEVLLSDLTVVVLITTAGSTYFIKYKNQLFELCKPLMGFCFSGSNKREQFGSAVQSKDHKVILFGASRVGTDLLETFKKLKHKCLVVDYDPQTIDKVKKRHVDVMYGDATDPSLLDEIDFKKVKMVASTIPDIDVNIMMVSQIRLQNPTVILICVSQNVKDTLKLYECGATYVIMPHYLGGKHTSLMVEEYGFAQKHFLKERFLHIDHLKKNGHNYVR